MGLFDWLGPLNAGSKRRGWDALPAPVAEQKSYPYIDDQRAIIISPLVSGPGASDLVRGHRKGDANSAVWACLQAIATAYAEAPIHAYRQTSPKEREPLAASPLGAFLTDCNPAFDIIELMVWVQWAKHVDGNAYLRKLRSGDPETGNVVQLWPISPTRISPITTKGSGDFISFYRYYMRPGQFEDISTDNIIHFRAGLDDGDMRLGCSDLKHLMREISSDDQATRYADRLLANLAIPGLSMEFDKEAAPIDQPTADMLKARVAAAYGGDNVGAPAVLSPGGKLVTHGFSPEQMDLRVLHTVPEERISAVLRVPAIVAGLGAGLARSTFANFKEAREAFTEATILPAYAADDRILTKHLAREFSSDRQVVIAHDISQMRALADDENAKALRLQTYVVSGILDVNEARAEIGREPRALVPASDPAGAQAPGGDSLPATRSRAPLTLLRKSIDDLPSDFDALKLRVGPDWEAALVAFLEAQLGRVHARLRAGHDTADGLVAEGESTLLGEALRPLQGSLLEDVSRLVVAELSVDFQLDDPRTREFLRRAGSQIVGITDTTRSAVRAALIAGQTAGEGIPQLAARLAELPAFGPARGRVVARAERGPTQIEAAYANYRASGVVVGIRIRDGDFDAACAARDGRVVALDAAVGTPTLLHPNCTAAWLPITDAAELTRSA